MKTPTHSYEIETQTLLADLTANGFTPESCDNGGGVEKPTLVNLTACDEVYLFARENKTGKLCTLFLVFGNSPGELVADYSAYSPLEFVVSQSSSRWN